MFYSFSDIHFFTSYYILHNNFTTLVAKMQYKKFQKCDFLVDIYSFISYT
nr:MAG TPA: hypothetical protein [Caudoviricetes sp.]